MNKRRVIAGAWLALTTVTAGPLASQSPDTLNKDCDPVTAFGIKPNPARPEPDDTILPGVLIESQKAALAEGNFWRATTNIFRAFSKRAESWPDSVRRRFDNQADSLALAFMRADAAAPNGTIDTDLFSPTLVVLGKYRLFEGPDSLVFVAQDLIPWRREACWQAIAVNEVVRRRADPGYTAGATVFAKRVKEWEAFHAAAYEPFPWERPFTAWLDRRTDNALDDLRPPRYQVILLHPGIGSTLRGSLSSWRKGDLRSSPTIWWELAGLVRYNSRYTGRYGASLLMAIPEDGGVGLGPMLHVSKYALAYVFQNSGDGESGRGVVLTVDLYKFITGGPKPPKQIADAAKQ